MVQYNYPNCYKWIPWDEINKISHKRMWWTDDKAKAMMVSTMIHMCDDKLYRIASGELYREMSVFEGRPSEDTGNYKFEAASGKDDLVIAFGLMALAMWQTPKLRANMPDGDRLPSPQALGIDAAPKSETFDSVLAQLTGESPIPTYWDPMVSV